MLNLRLSPPRVLAVSTAITLTSALLIVSGLGNITEAGYSVPGSPSAHAESILRKHIPDGAGAWIVAAVSAPNLYEVAATVEPLSRLREVVSVETLATGREVSEDAAPAARIVRLVGIRLRLSYNKAEGYLSHLEDVLRANSAPKATFVLLGEVAVSHRYSTIIQTDLTHAETLGLPISFLLLLVAFLSFAAAMLPAISAAFTLAITLGCMRLLSLYMHLSVFSISTSSAVALGLSMDYALLVVTRFREESARVSSIECAVTRTMRTAGRTVVLSGLTIAVSLPALLIINVGLFSSIAIGGIVASLTAVLVATTVLPAVLRLFGQHIDRLSLAFAVRAAHRGTLWRRVAALVTSHPGTAALLSSAVLLALAVPAHSLRLDFRNVSALPSKDPITREVGTISNVFGAGASGVVEVVTRDPLQRSISILWQAPHMRSIWQVVKGTGGWTAIYALLKVAPDSDEAHQTITRMRQLFADHKNDTFVGGVTASEMDLTQRVAERMPIAIAIAVLVSLLTLALGLRSIVIPLIAVLCSVLSVSATLGVLLLLFPSAGGADRLAFFVPLVIFILVLGLANDYEVFLLSRVREAARTGMSTKTSVSHALQQTGRPITLAGYTVAAIFVAFCFSSLEAMRQLGVGVAVGVALDVSLIRCVLVPALTVLLGPWNWWLPRLRGIAPT